MKRGELRTVAGGVHASKPLPALILQDDVFAGTDSVTVAPLTTRLVDAPLLRVRVVAGQMSGLQHESHVMIDNITTVRGTTSAPVSVASLLKTWSRSNEP